jgi:8-oxo-dGTP pyrophosphatase MutT (NUDIX family)
MSKVKPWRELARERLLDCRIFDVEEVTAESPVDGSAHGFVRLCSPDWVQIVPETPAGEIVMVKQYRHGPATITLEIPAGMIDPGESPEAAGKRECLEETGYEARDVYSLGSINPNPAFLGNRLHAFVACDVERVTDIQNTGTEQTEVLLVPRADLRRMLRDGVIDHALVAATLWRYLDRIGSTR